MGQEVHSQPPTRPLCGSLFPPPPPCSVTPTGHSRPAQRTASSAQPGRVSLPPKPYGWFPASSESKPKDSQGPWGPVHALSSLTPCLTPPTSPLTFAPCLPPPQGPLGQEGSSPGVPPASCLVLRTQVSSHTPEASPGLYPSIPPALVRTVTVLHYLRIYVPYGPSPRHTADSERAGNCVRCRMLCSKSRPIALGGCPMD